MAIAPHSTREHIIAALRQALEPLDHVNAMWLAGSAATGGLDELSDIDAVLDVADGRHGDAFAAAEAALEALAPIAHRLALPEPTWHGHSQRLYRLEGCPEHLMIDLCVMQRSSQASRFAEAEIHGQPVILFDKLGVVETVALDRAAHREKMRVHLSALRARFHLLRHMAGKEVARGNEIDALFRYQSFVLVPLISVLRTAHAPMYHDFAPRYLKRDLPADVYQRLMRLSYVADIGDLETKLAEALAWAEDELETIDIDVIDF
jgi:predicted nucleotidyltransferase